MDVIALRMGLYYGQFTGTGNFKCFRIYKAHFSKFSDVVIGHPPAYPDLDGQVFDVVLSGVEFFQYDPFGFSYSEVEDG